MFKQEIDPKLAWGAIVGVLLIALAVYYFVFRTPSGELSAKEARLGNPVKPGELPPGTPPPPWAPPANTAPQPPVSTNPP